MALGYGAEVEVAPATTTTAPTAWVGPASPGPKTQAGASSTLAVRTTPMCLSERNADTSAQSFGTYCEHGCDNGLY